MAFKTSSYSKRCACIEVDLTAGPDTIAVREGDRPGEVIRTNHANWGAFIDGVKAGEFDLITVSA